MITIKPFGGLGNRMRVLHSVLSLKYERRLNVKILWEHSRSFNCSISDLFIVPEDIAVQEFTMSLEDRLKRKITENFRKGPLSRYKYDLILREKDIIEMRNNNYDFLNLLNYKSVLIETCQWFYTGDEGFLYLNPIGQISDQVQQITRNFNKQTIGIHVRRTDHTLSIKASPLSEFKKRMQFEIDRNKNTMFFLSTDSEEVENELKVEFKNRILTYENKELSRNSSKGIKDAFVDMLCLSHTNKIYGSYHSTFSHIASLMNDIELRVINVLPKQKEAN
ncbi:MAG: hypothetical protein EA391_01680 [Balneolaceae bacterium]|nr:MAG: hypothetical protein EA391_01680 [Balneolaceae bacterium]